MEEVYEEPNAVSGTFLLNNFLALVLFDTGASHSLISRVFVDRNKIPNETINTPIKISSTGGGMIATFGCRQLTLGIEPYSFPISLIVLESQGLDVILGMNWITEYKGVIDCAKRVITLTTPEKKCIRFKQAWAWEARPDKPSPARKSWAWAAFFCLMGGSGQQKHGPTAYSGRAWVANSDDFGKA
jgi:hypothetical protein